MGTFKVGKSIDDIEEAVLMPVDWYEFEISDDPVLKPNNALKKMVSEDATDEEIGQAIEENEKAGFNLTVSLRSESPEVQFDGRKLTAWLPYPSAADEERYDGRGMKIFDSKFERLVDFVTKFGGSVDEGEKGETEITLVKGMKGCCYVTQGKIPDREELGNSVDIFAGFKEYGE